MSEQAPLSALDLASLLCSRLCHDAIGPVGAIMNGLELLEDESAGEMRETALDLVRRSARQAVSKLEFARVAYGAGGGRSLIPASEVGRLAEAGFAGERATLAVELPEVQIGLAETKLMLNLVVFALAAIPRGGAVTAVVTGAPDDLRFAIRASGPGARLPQNTEIATRGLGATAPDARSAPAYLIWLLSREARKPVSVALDGEDVVIEAAPAAQADLRTGSSAISRST